MNKQGKANFFSNEDGAVLIEFGLVLPLIVIMMMFLIICYEVVQGQIELQVEAYSAMRRKTVSINIPGGEMQDVQFVKVVKKRNVIVPGKMPKVLKNTYVIPIEAAVCSYAGVMRGFGVNRWENPPGDRYYDAPELHQVGLCR